MTFGSILTNVFSHFSLGVYDAFYSLVQGASSDGNLPTGLQTFRFLHIFVGGSCFLLQYK